jgi:hypothetical protein
MDFLEKNLEDIIFEADNEKLKERGLFIPGKKKRQVRIGNYGIADIVSWTSTPNRLEITVFELKQKTIDATALMQAFRYKVGIERYISSRKPKLWFEVNIVLIGKEIGKGDFCYMLSEYSNFYTYTYSYGIDGIKFESQSGYYLRQEGFGG